MKLVLELTLVFVLASGIGMSVLGWFASSARRLISTTTTCAALSRSDSPLRFDTDQAATVCSLSLSLSRITGMLHARTEA